MYGLTGGISNNLVTKTVRSVLGREELFKEYLPREIRSRYKLCEYNYAIKEIHFRKYGHADRGAQPSRVR